MTFPVVDSVEAAEQRIKELLKKAQQTKPTGSVEPQLSTNDLLCDGPVLFGDNAQNQNVTEAAAKGILHELVAKPSPEDALSGDVWNLLDIVLACSERNQCDGLLIFYLAEELLDSQSIDGCRRVFDYLESRRERLVAGDFLQSSGSSKRIVVLRFCNELLRRLSRAEDAVFCGRVFIFLFQSFPLGDKSSVNSRGEFHVENVTVFDERPVDDVDGMDLDLDPGQDVPSTTTGNVVAEADGTAGKDLDSKVLDAETLYPIFWTLQQAFSDPLKLASTEYLEEFKAGIEHTIAKFKSVPKVMSTKKESKPNHKDRPKIDSNAESSSRDSAESAGSEDDGSPKHDLNDTEAEFASPYNPKYLTSRDLFDLELSDLAFQRHILVQALVLLDFLLSLTERSKEKTQKWLSSVSNQNRAVQYNFTLSVTDAEWATKTRTTIATYLQVLPDGKFYYRMVDTVLSRDKNWVRWKMENCPPIARAPISASDFQDTKTAAGRACASKRLKAAPVGSMDLSFLSDTAMNSGMERLKDPSRYRIPTVMEMHMAMQEGELDLDMAVVDEDKLRLQEAQESKKWRALRIASKDRLGLFDKIDDGKHLEALLELGSSDDAAKDEPAATEMAEAAS